MARFAVIGGFTTAQRQARGEGVSAFRIAAPGEWVRTDLLGGLSNPSFLITDPTRPLIYAVHGDGDVASTLALDSDTGTLRLLGQAPTGGGNGVHAALAPTGRHLLVANYGSGTVAVLRVDAEGCLGEIASLFALPGLPGPHRSEQAMSHPHHIVFDPSGGFVLVPDKGLDRVFVLRFDANAGTLALHGEAAMRPGAGPRHVVFHPSLGVAFVMNELDSTVAVCRWQAGVLSPTDLATTLPPDFFGASAAAAIVVSRDGGSVYASNRGHDSVARFMFDATTQRLVPLGWIASGGRDPRFMTLDAEGEQLLVANEQGDSVACFDTEPRLRLERSFAVRSPSSIAFV